MKRLIFLLLVLIIYIVPCNAQLLNQKGTFIVSVNPLKIVYGLVNIEVEYYLDPGYSVYLSSEYLISGYFIKRKRHPDMVSRFGGRYHFYQKENYEGENDLYGGLFVGCSYSKSYKVKNGMDIGADFGYRYQVGPSILVGAKALATCPLKSRKVLFGFEGLIGYINNF